MATKANFGGAAPHTAGLFADMTVDGPEIGTLVLVVDRAKNLPNRKTMGKQNPYCAARLGKEAQKTDTDRRGGQTPRWDQELRFTVHDSPDYYKLKISAFSEDKKTDLIGEAWVDLTKVVVPGGGKDDLWQGLNYKGKYAGELRIELTYYDSRTKPEGSVMGMEDFRQSLGSGSGKVKRRPLPTPLNGGHLPSDIISGPAIPGRAKHGPRDLMAPARANSMPPENTMHSMQNGGPVYGQAYNSSPMGQMQQPPPNQWYNEYDGSSFNQMEQPDFLPQLPPSNRQRDRQPPAQRFGAARSQHSHLALSHSHSAPTVPQALHAQYDYEDESQLDMNYPEPIPDLDYQHQQLSTRPRRSSFNPGYQPEYEDSYNQQPQLPTLYGELAPPPPPVHSNSAPVVPHYGHAGGRQMSSSPVAVTSTPPHLRHHSVPNTSPLQGMDRGYAPSQRTPARGFPPRGSSIDGYGSSPDQSPYNSSPPPHQHTASPYARPSPSRPLPHRNSNVEQYQAIPPRPHPLSQEVPRPRSPLPPLPQHIARSPSPQPGYPPYQQDYRNSAPPTQTRDLSPQPPLQNSTSRPKSSYSIRHPVRAFESADESPLSTSRPPLSLQTSQRSTPARKSVSSLQNTPNSVGSIPYSPDSFNVLNPSAELSTLPDTSSPRNPYMVQPGTLTALRQSKSGPIVGWHGQEIDPSDHLPVDSWAPEPEPKIPNKTYGLGRDRDFGPRSVSKDTVVSYRSKGQSQSQSSDPESPTRNRLQKKSLFGGGNKSPNAEPLRERHNFNSVSVPNPYSQQEYGQGFYWDGQQSPANDYNSPTDSLAREISNIDIGGGRSPRGGGNGYADTAYVPVRSHKDRRTFY